MRRCPRKSGFVLLLILVLVAICGIAMAATARRYGEKIMQSNAAVKELQFRWGACSCQRTILPQANGLLIEQCKPKATPPALMCHQVMLGGMRFNLVVGDECAKSNVNLLAKQHDDAGMLACVRRLQGDDRRLLNVELSPLADADAPADDSAFPIKYEGFEQLFAIRHPSELGLQSLGGVSACRRLTFWSDGQVNLWRADIPVLRETLQGLLTESNLVALDELRRKTAVKDLDRGKAFAKMQLTDEQTTALMPLIRETSDCFSLWVYVQGANRSWYRLYVQRQDGGGNNAKQWVFAW